MSFQEPNGTARVYPSAQARKSTENFMTFEFRINAFLALNKNDDAAGLAGCR
jgi:hypothetical protein